MPPNGGCGSYPRDRCTCRAVSLSVSLAASCSAKFLQDIIEGPVGCSLSALQQPHRPEDERSCTDRPRYLGGFGCRTHVGADRLVTHGPERGHATTRHEQDGRAGHLREGVGWDHLHVYVGVHGLHALCHDYHPVLWGKLAHTGEDLERSGQVEDR